jgi:glycosyltransferase involved in cell wall biosynthesis
MKEAVTENLSRSMNEPVTILTPVFNDWISLRTLLMDLDNVWEGQTRPLHVVIVNDGSTETAPDDWRPAGLRHIPRVTLLECACNLGHQRAIATGLTYVAQSIPSGLLVVMDSDGEDRPSDVPALLQALEADLATDVMFAERKRRSESFWFRAGYHTYRTLHWLLTGIGVRFGNFSALRIRSVSPLIHQGALWNHYAAAVVRSRLRYKSIPTTRGYRYEGRSKLNAPHLVAHGFGALSVFYDVVCARLSAAASAIVGVAGLLMIGLWAAGGVSWPVVVIGGLMAALLMLLLLLNVIALVALRSAPSFIPARDASAMIKDVRTRRVDGEQA